MSHLGSVYETAFVVKENYVRKKRWNEKDFLKNKEKTFSYLVGRARSDDSNLDCILYGGERERERMSMFIVYIYIYIYVNTYCKRIPNDDDGAGRILEHCAGVGGFMLLSSNEGPTGVYDQ